MALNHANFRALENEASFHWPSFLALKKWQFQKIPAFWRVNIKGCHEPAPGGDNHDEGNVRFSEPQKR